MQISAGEAGASERAATIQSQGSRAELGISTVAAKYDKMANIANARELSTMPEHAGKSKEQLLRLGKQKREVDLRKIEQYHDRRTRVREDLLRKNPHLKLPPTNEHMKQIYAREYAADPCSCQSKVPKRCCTRFKQGNLEQGQKLGCRCQQRKDCHCKGSRQFNRLRIAQARQPKLLTKLC